MSFQEKLTWIQMVTIAGVYSVYAVVIAGRVHDAPVGEVAYATAMLVTIGASIVISIVASIAIAIATRDCGQSDERDFNIGRYGDYYGNQVFAISALVPLALTMADYPHFWIANALFLAYFVGSMVGAVVKVFAYRRGF